MAMQMAMANGNGKASAANRATAAAAPRGDRHPTLNPRYSFAEFVVGSANQFAHAAALAVANQPGEKYNPLFIYGGVGLGKTHLVTAIGHHIWASGDRPRKVLFMPAEIFMNEMINSLRRDKMNEFREKFRRVDTLILDDVQFLAGRERTQEEFFHTFNALHAERHQIILTSDKIPREIPGLEDRLRNRFESGLIADIAPPDLETRVAIVQKKAVLENLRMAPEVAMYIAQSVSSNVRELEGCLTRLAALASLNQSAITVDFARQALQDLIRNARREARRRIDPEDGCGFFPYPPGGFEVEKAHPAHRVLPSGGDVSVPQADRQLVSDNRRAFRARPFDGDSRAQPDHAARHQ